MPQITNAAVRLLPLSRRSCVRRGRVSEFKIVVLEAELRYSIEGIIAPTVMILTGTHHESYQGGHNERGSDTTANH